MFAATEREKRDNWEKPLGEMEKVLAETLNKVRQRQKALTESLSPAKTEEGTESNWPVALSQAYERVQELQHMADRAAGNMAEVETALANGEGALKEWLQAAVAARGKLANWINGAVG